MRTVIVLLVAAGVAHAEPAEQQRPIGRKWHIGIEGMTDFPLWVGAQVWAELPYRIRLTMSSGELPESYLEVVNKIAVSAGAYSQQQADFITELLERAAIWRIQAGWRPFPRLGGYVEGGFGVVTLEKGIGLAPVIQLVTGLMVPQEANVGLGYEITSVIEVLGVEVGWIWYPWRDLTVRVSLAFTGAVGAQVDIQPNFASTIQKPFTQAAERRAQEILERDFMIPTVGVAVGWRLF
jgi:hypothetical protein